MEFELTDIFGNTALKLKKGQIDQSIAYMKEKNIMGIIINYLYLPEIEPFLFRRLNFIKYINLLNWEIENIDDLYELINLETLIIQTYEKTPIDFTYFPNLRHCSFNWRKNSESIFKVHGLKYVSISGFAGSNLKNFTALQHLSKINLTQSPKLLSLEGIERLPHIQEMELSYVRNLENLSKIEDCQTLRTLRFSSCKKIVSELDKVYRLANLEVLELSNLGEIENLSGIEKLTKLRILSFEGTVIRDGNLSQLLKLESLKVLVFEHKRHYSHRRLDILNQI